MREMMLSRGKDVQFTFDANGFAATEILPGHSENLQIFRCVLKAGHTWYPELFSLEDKVQIFAFITPYDGLHYNGYFTTNEAAYNIEGYTTFIPEFDKDKNICIHAGVNDLQFYRFLGKFNEWDQARYKYQHYSLPNTRNFVKNGVQYTEEFTGMAGSNLRQYIQVEGKSLGRWSMGYNVGEGPTFIGTHTHSDVEQWYFILPGSSFTYTADKGDVELEEYDLTYTDMGVPHGSKARADQKIDYFWIELCTNGYEHTSIKGKPAT